MEYLFLTVLVACASLVNYLIYKHYTDRVCEHFQRFERNVQELNAVSDQVKEVRTKLQHLVDTLNTLFLPVDRPAPNNAVKADPTIEFSEQNMMNLPKDVKFEVEGGETTVPPGFEEITNG